MLKDTWVIILLFTLIGICGTMILMDKFYCKPCNYDESIELKELRQSLDSLNNDITFYQKQNDSLQLVIDTTSTKIITIKEKYEKDYIDVLNQSTLDDFKFFTNYLSENDWRLSGSNNTPPVESDESDLPRTSDVIERNTSFN